MSDFNLVILAVCFIFGMVAIAEIVRIYFNRNRLVFKSKEESDSGKKCKCGKFMVESGNVLLYTCICGRAYIPTLDEWSKVELLGVVQNYYIPKKEEKEEKSDELTDPEGQ